MAKVTFGGGIAAMSGKLGGAVAARNKGGAYMRTFVKPTNPNTPAQAAARARLSTYSAEWRTLTDAQRTAWNSFADQHPVLDRLGASILLTGSQTYVKINTNRDVAGDPTTNSTVPSETDFAVGPLNGADVVTTIAGPTITMALTATAAADQIYFCYAAAPVSAGVTNTTSEERLVAVITLDAADITEETTPNLGADYVTSFGSLTGATGLRCNLCLYEYSEGQLSQPTRGTSIFS